MRRYEMTVTDSRTETFLHLAGTAPVFASDNLELFAAEVLPRLHRQEP